MHPKNGEIILTDTYSDFGNHYMTAIMPAQVRKPKQKAADADFTEYAAQETPAGPETKGFAMPKLSALLGTPVTPEDETEDEDGREE